MIKSFLIFSGVFLGCLVLFFGLNLSQKETIYISDSEINNLLTVWENQTGRAPNADEINMIIDNLVEEEILYKESLKLGLDKNDKIIKRRLIQKLEFFKEGEFIENLNEKDLINFYEENLDLYKRGKRYSFQHIFFSNSENNDKKINLILLELEKNPPIRSISGIFLNSYGDPFIHGDSFVEKNSMEIDADFGKGFSNNFIGIKRNKWYGPFESIYGDHLIYILHFQPEEILPYEKVKKSVINNYNNSLKDEAMKNYIYSIKNKYDVIIGAYR